MSGVQQIAPVQGVDVANEMLKYGQIGQQNASIGQTAAQTGLIGQQTLGAALANRVLGARLGAYGGVTGAPGMIGAAPNPSIAGQDGSQQLTTGPGGEVIDGIAYPRHLAAAYKLAFLNENAAAQMASIQAQRTTRLSQAVNGILGPNGEPPDVQTWNNFIRQEYDNGEMTNADLGKLTGRPELAPQISASLAPPADQPSLRGAQAYATGVAGARTTPREINVPGPNGTTIPSVTTNAAVLGLAPPPAYGSPLAQRVGSYENSTGNPAATNASGPGGAPTSSAEGDHQWTRATWLDAVKQYAPQWAEGKTEQQVLDLRKDPALSAWMFDQRAPSLAAAASATVPGGTPTDSWVALTHFLGPAGAQQLVRSPSSTPFRTAFPQQAAANPQYAGMTTGQIAQQFAQRYGTAPFQSAAGAPPPVPGAPGIPAATPVGPPTLAPTVQRLADLDKTQITEDERTNAGNVTAGLNANKAGLTMREIRDTLPDTPTGSFGIERTALNNFAQTFGGPWTQQLAQTLTGFQPGDTAKMQELNKLFLNNVVSQEQAVGNVRIGAMFTNYFAKASPSIDMQKPAIKDILNLGLIGQQMAKDYAEDSNNHFMAARGTTADSLAAGGYSRYQPLTAVDQQWLAPNSVRSPDVYAAAAKILNGTAPADAFKSLNRNQQVAALGVIDRADPGARATILARMAPR